MSQSIAQQAKRLVTRTISVIEVDINAARKPQNPIEPWGRASGNSLGELAINSCLLPLANSMDWGKSRHLLTRIYLPNTLAPQKLLNRWSNL